ncbi:MAG: hypothetical protein AAB229_01395, partial [Candidatus Hydrogenedentota bacterium]
VNSVPTCSFTVPVIGSTINGTETLAFTINAIGRTIRDTAVSIDGGSYTATSGDTFIVNTLPLADGAHTFRVRFYDTGTSDTFFSDPVTFVVDNHGPSISNLSVTYPTGQTRVRPGQPVTFKALVRDALSNLDSVVLYFDTPMAMFDNGTNGDEFSGDSIFSLRWALPFDMGFTGDTTWRVVATDTGRNFQAGNSETVSATLQGDSAPPIVYYMLTSDPDTVYSNGQTVTIKVYIDSDAAGDGESGLAVTANFASFDSNYTAGAVAVSEDGPGTYVIRYTISANNVVANRLNLAVRIRVTDGVGLSDTTIAAGDTLWVISVVNGAPVFAFTTPAAGSTISGKGETIVFTITGAGRFFTDTRISVDGAAYATTTTGTTHLVNTVLTTGLHTFRLRAFDTSTGDTFT